MSKFRIPYSITITGELEVEAVNAQDAYRHTRKWLSSQPAKDTHRLLLEQGAGTMRVHREQIDVVKEGPEPSQLTPEQRKYGGTFGEYARRDAAAKKKKGGSA